VGYLNPCSSYYSFVASPNPVNSTLSVEINIEDEEVYAQLRTVAPAGQTAKKTITRTPEFELKLFTLLGGNLVYRTTSAASTVSLDVSHLPSGVYILQIHDGSDNPPQTRRITVSH
jgi:hypothetical protein